MSREYGGVENGAPHRGESPEVAQLVPLVYDELRELALSLLRRRRADRSHTLQPTALVHEAYVRMAAARPEGWDDRSHFFAVAATAMRHVLADYARRRGASKRGGSWARVMLERADDGGPGRDVDLVGLDAALTELARLQPRQARIVELRFLAGMSVDDAAAVLGVSCETVKRDWRMARAWLWQRLAAG